MLSYRDSIGVWVFSATCRMMERTILLLLYRSSHLTISSGETRRFDRSMYPAIQNEPQLQHSLPIGSGSSPTLLLVDTKHHHNLVTTDSDKLLDTSNTSSGKFRKKNHAVDVVVLQQLNVSTHLGDLSVILNFLSDSPVFPHFQPPQPREAKPTCLTLTMTKLSISGYFSS